MEQLKKLTTLLKEFTQLATNLEKAADLQALDELKLQGTRMLIELSRQVNRVAPEFTQFAKRKRSSLTDAAFQAIMKPKTIPVEQTSTTEEVKVEKKKAKKAKK